MSTAVLGPPTKTSGKVDPSSDRRPSYPGSPWPALVYAAITLLTCSWVLTLPILPSQDEPLHLYYVEIFRQLLHHQHTAYTGTYYIRHFVPPYATYYYSLIGLGHFVSLETADKLFAAANIAFFALAAFVLLRTLCPRSRWSPFLVLPVLLNWPTFMGFANFILSVNLSLLALAAWCLSVRRPRGRYIMIFLALIAAMILTHPLPWAFTVGFASLELFVRFWRSRTGRAPVAPAHLRRDLAALAVACLSYLYFLPFKSKTQIMTRLVYNKTLHAWRPIPTPTFFGRMYAQGFSLIHTQGIVLFLGSGLAHLYRLGIGLLFGGSLVLALWALFRRDAIRVRARWQITDTWLLYAILLTLGLILVPDSGAGGYFLSTRMQLLVYVCCVVAAAPALERRPHLAASAAAFSVALTLLTLSLAVRYINPAAHTIVSLRNVPAPSANNRPGLLMRPVGVAFPSHLNYDAYNWAPVHFFRWHGLVLFNTAWLGDKLIPIAPRPDALPRLDNTFFNQAPQFGDRLLRNDPTAEDTLSKASFLLLQKEDVKHTQHPFSEVGGDSTPGPFAATWSCTDAPNHHWYLCSPTSPQALHAQNAPGSSPAPHAERSR